MNPGAPRMIETRLAVVGSGFAGLAAAVFAAQRGIATAICGHGGALAYTSGYFDLLGRLAPPDTPDTPDTPDAPDTPDTPYMPHTPPGRVDDPWQALGELRRAQPRHPLARIDDGEIRRAFHDFIAFVGAHGIAYTAPGPRNLTALTPAGTTKPTLSVPRTMATGPQALAAATPCVIVDIEGLTGFSGRECVANLAPRWPGLTTRRIAFPNLPAQPLFAEVMARALEVPAAREAFAAALRAVAGQARVIGLPAMLGMHRSDDVHGDLERRVGLPIFEIPTMPPGVPGTRLRELFEDALPRHGVAQIAQHEVQSLRFDDRGVSLELADAFGPIHVRAQAVILATGRFVGGGLRAQRDGIREALLDLPVTQPASRADWYRASHADPRGHPVNRAGIEVDDAMRPLARDGRPHDPRLFAAGSLLAHQDAIRSRSGVGVALATAWRAVSRACPAGSTVPTGP